MRQAGPASYDRDKTKMKTKTGEQKKMKKMIAVAVMLCAGPVSAVQFDSKIDMVDQANVEMKENALQIESVTPVAADKAGAAILPGVRIMGQPIGDNVIRERLAFLDTSVTLVVNNDKDRVGARLEFCEKTYDDMGPKCESILYYLPELVYDASTKEIKWGGEVVQKSAFMGWRKMNRGFKLGFTSTKQSTERKPFDRIVEVRYAYDVYLEKVSK